MSCQLTAQQGCEGKEGGRGGQGGRVEDGGGGGWKMGEGLGGWGERTYMTHCRVLALARDPC